MSTCKHKGFTVNISPEFHCIAKVKAENREKKGNI